MLNHSGVYLKALREQKKLTTRQLGQMVNCSHSLIARFETGERTPGLERLWQIINYLDGDFGEALYLLCIDAGVPEVVARAAIRE